MAASGTLFIVATPVGNLQDMTPRALEALSAAPIVACEDTRRTRRLLQHFGIRPGRLISYHKFNERRQARVILHALRRGEDVALVSDGGTPGLSDPGALVIDEALEARLRVSPVPGASAASAAFSVAGFPAAGFLFAGFLPVKGTPRREALAALGDQPWPVVLFEAPHRIRKTADDLLAALGDRKVTLLREATKMHEEVYRTTLGDLGRRLADRAPRGEFTLVLDASPRARSPVTAVTPARLRQRYRQLVSQGVPRRQALKTLVQETGLPRAAVYSAVRVQGEAHRSRNPT
ncbi:MAG: 16S rRNA (cytidine(1402)-2'-O)-methyltransferase [Acidobacteriota bacterium]